MSCDLIFDPGVLQPSEAAILHEATLQAIRAIGAEGQADECERRQVAADVIRVARSGYARTVTGGFDIAALAQAAALRFRAFRQSPGS